MNEQVFLAIIKNKKQMLYLKSLLEDKLEIGLTFVYCNGDLVQLHKLLKEHCFSYAILCCDRDEEYDLLVKLLLHMQNDCRTIMLCQKAEDFYRRQLHDCYFVIRQTHCEDDTQLLAHKLSLQRQKDLVYTFHQISNHTVLHVRHIYYIESMKNYILIHKETESIKDRITMKSIQCDPALKEFIMISRGILVNRMHIAKIEKHSVFLDNKEELFISRSMYMMVHDIMKHK